MMDADDEDIFLWPDGTWCYREEFVSGEFSHVSDDYRVIQFASTEWDSLVVGGQ